MKERQKKLHLQYAKRCTEKDMHVQNFHKAPAKRSQHANATCHNIVGRNMLRAFGHCVVTCWVLLDHI